MCLDSSFTYSSRPLFATQLLTNQIIGFVLPRIVFDNEASTSSPIVRSPVQTDRCFDDTIDDFNQHSIRSKDRPSSFV